jgi:aspartyl-tRNA(Asn)/glutamyl-tRNA(Gln) amidotransferase subunit A
MIAEAYALHEKDFQTRPQDFGHHMFARIALGAFLSASDYVEALRQRRELCLEFARALDGVDVIVSANSTGPAPRIDSLPTFGTVERASYTGPYNLTGSPALSVPIGFEDGFPLAFQIAGKPFDEAGVMRVGHAFEQATEFHRRRPAIAAPLPGHA